MIELDNLCDHSRERIGTPFSFQLEGAWWDAATNGHAMLAVRQGAGERARENKPPVSQVLTDAPASHQVTIETLLSWLSESKRHMACPECDGDGESRHSCDCKYCEIDETCEACDGEGQVKSVEPFEFEGIEFDRAILAKFFAPLGKPAGQVTFCKAGELDPFELRGDGWRLVMMPRRRGTDNVTPVPQGIFTPVAKP